MDKAISFIIGFEASAYWFTGQPKVATILFVTYAIMSVYQDYKLWESDQKYQNKLSKSDHKL